MPEQLTFELAPPQAPSFDNFLPGANDEIVDALIRAARGALHETGVVLWGAGGCGKSHLLQALTHEAARAGRCARYVAPADVVPAEPPGGGALVAVDDVENAAAQAQGALFTLYNALAATGGQLVVASALPPARLPLRDDLRTRLAHGLVYEVAPLADTAKPAALRRYAQARGVKLPDDVIDYLLAHFPRDMASLLRAVTALDRESLATRRGITVPLVRALLAKVDRPRNA
ncbi:MAG TPA: DnaA regulatory inactivator Hda [Casimicrobiaceae bacterium]